MTITQDRSSGGPLTAVAAHGLGLFSGAIVEQHFDGHTAALTVGSGHELLDDDRVEAQCELLFDLRLLRGREDIDDAMNRLRGVARVQRRQNQMTGLGGCQRSGNSLEVAHFANEDDFGILTQRRAECRRE